MTLPCSGCADGKAGAQPADPCATPRFMPLTVHMPQSAQPDIAGLDSFLQLVVGLTGAQGGAIRALTQDGEFLRLMTAVGVSDEFRRNELLIGVCGVCGDAVRDDDIRTSSDTTGCMRLLSACSQRGHCFGHVIAVPLEYKDEPVGVFNLFFERPDDTHGQIEVLLKPIGQLLGLTLENSMLERENSRAWLVHERQSMAADIHDSLAQTIAFARMRLPLLEDAIAAHDDANCQRYCGELDQELKRAHRGVRALITHFSAGADGRGLSCELNEVVERFRDSSGIALEFDERIPDLRLPGESEVQLFFIVQEALANIRKHAGATRARLVVRNVRDGIEVVIEDNGRGLVPTAGQGAGGPTGSFGLRIMRERAQRFGGRVTIESLPEGGARVRVFVPESTVL